jgi:hypothetical protein
MRNFTTKLFTRVIVIVLAVSLLFSGFVTYRHFLPKGQNRWITLEHQIRRVLAHAERDNLKIGTAYDEDESLANPLQQLEPPGLEVIVARGYIVASSQFLIAPKIFSFERSPVLSL